VRALPALAAGGKTRDPETDTRGRLEDGLATEEITDPPPVVVILAVMQICAYYILSFGKFS